MSQTKKTAKSTKLTIDDWVQRLMDQRMPVFAHTAQDVSRIISDQDSSAAELTQVILRDAAMAARVLRVANSPFRRTGGPPVCTISRAVVKLGFSAIRSIIMSVSVVEAFLKGEKRDRVIKALARALHAATQAQALCVQSDPRRAEDAFVAALLYHLGSMSFWCLSNDLTRHLEAELKKNPTVAPVVIERKILGFTLHELTIRISTDWGLGPTLHQALTQPESDAVATAITMGYRIAEVVDTGWDDKAIAVLTAEIAKDMQVPANKIKELIHESAKIAAENARLIGAKDVAKIMPLPESDVGSDALSEDSSLDALAQETMVDQEIQDQCFEPNPGLQLACLRELATVVEEKTGTHELLSIILEGIHRGIGMDRALFALLSVDKTCLKAKYVLGADQDTLMARFVFSAQPGGKGPLNIFGQQMKIQQVLNIPADPPPQLMSLLPDSLLAVTGRGGFYSAPIIVNGTSIGLFYADRCPSGREMDQSSYDSFKHFAQQASLGLDGMTKRR